MRKVIKKGTNKLKITTDKNELKPGKNEVLIQVKAAGVNPEDIFASLPRFAPAKHTETVPGLEISGDITAVGQDVDQNLVDQAVIALVPGGGYCEQAVVSTDYIFPMPRKLDYADAAALLVNYITAYQLVVQNARPAPEETVLIHDVDSAYGCAIADLLKKSGCKLIGSAPVKKHYALEDFDLDLLIDYNAPDWTKQIKDFTGTQGVDIIFDPLNSKFNRLNYNLLSSGGRIGFYGYHNQSLFSGKFSRKKLLQDNKAVFGVDLTWLARDTGQLKKITNTLFSMIEKNSISPLVYKTFSLFQVKLAWNTIIKKQNTGKAVLEISV
ncbi:MAG TPA: zinc-binding dehydrogenase [Spirochaetota bacterium]|nr:zinc-binding dehydrogenase [Spirochaetota bacterium]